MSRTASGDSVASCRRQPDRHDQPTTRLARSNHRTRAIFLPPLSRGFQFFKQAYIQTQEKTRCFDRSRRIYNATVVAVIDRRFNDCRVPLITTPCLFRYSRASCACICQTISVSEGNKRAVLLLNIHLLLECLASVRQSRTISCHSLQHEIHEHRQQEHRCSEYNRIHNPLEDVWGRDKSEIKCAMVVLKKTDLEGVAQPLRVVKDAIENFVRLDPSMRATGGLEAIIRSP